MNKLDIKEIIVVEGRDDTKRIQQYVNADTIETNGSAIDKTIIENIKHAQEVRGVIVFTDPDFPGEKIRKQIMEAIPDAKHAFISRKNGESRKKRSSLGVEHASREVIIEALQSVATPQSNSFESSITTEDLINFGLIAGSGSRRRREELGDRLRIGYTNGKQLKKRLSMFQISTEKFLKTMQDIIEEEKV